jgi:AAA15 family ATPase/GTPase
MLLQFSVENFLSFREPQVLSMLAAEGIDHPPHMVMEGPEGKKVLRCAAIYGANASGKSNLVKALEFGTNLVLKGTAPGDGLGFREFFRLDPDCALKPLGFQWEFYIAGRSYSYGFEISEGEISSEWLYVQESQQEVLFFKREEGHFNLGDSLATKGERAGFLNFLAQAIRRNQLFLAEARERNGVELSVVWEAFEKCQLVGPDKPFIPLIPFFRTNSSFAAYASELLSSFSTGVQSIQQSEVPNAFAEPIRSMVETADEPDKANILRALNSAWAEFAPDTYDISEKKTTSLRTVHQGFDGSLVSFGLYEESDGTRRLVHLAPLLFDIDRGRPDLVFAIDELERSLHPLLTRAFLERFFASTGKSQLLFTTHDTNLLDLNLLSRDAIWFTEKDPAGATVLYSLAEYKTDQISQLGPQLEKGYLQGRFGAIPFLGDASRLGWKKAAE